MPISSTQSFVDVEEYRAAIRPSNTEFLLTARSQPFRSAVTKVDLIDVGMQRLTENVARVWQILVQTPRTEFVFTAQPGLPIRHRGAELADNEIALIPKGVEVRQCTSGPISVAGLSLPEDSVAPHIKALFGQDLTPPRDHFTFTIPMAMMARLRDLHTAVTGLAETSPDIIANAGVARALDSSLTEAALNCLAAGRLVETRIAQRNHTAIVKRLYELVRKRPEEPIYLLDVCTTLGVSLRTLHLSCYDQLGIGPKRYLLLRRLHQAHKALQTGSPMTTSVTDIAMRFGFWQLGRFAATYRSIFGEPPSATLRRESN